VSIKSKYNVLEDRIHLILSPSKDEVAFSFWFSRAVWLNLIFAIQPFANKQKKDSQLEEIKKPKSPKSPKSPNKDSTREKVSSASSLVKAIKYKSLKDGMTILFIPLEGEIVSLKLNNKDLQSLNTMLLDLAEKIGWDPFPALKRLKDSQNAKKVISNIMSKSKYN